MNECDSQFGRLGDGGDGYRFSFKRNGSRVGWMDAGDNLHQGAFACAVLPNDSDYFAEEKGRVHVVERVHPREAFVDSGRL